MFDAAVETYAASVFRWIAGQCCFFIFVAGWAWYKRGRTHFFSELAIFSLAALSFARNDARRLERPEWFVLLSLALWIHMALIVREILTKGDAE